VTPNIEINLEQIKAFCQRWKVTEFALFGSVLNEHFKADSDVDVLVSFEPGAAWDLFDFVTMKDELEALFGRSVDLVEKASVMNPIRRRTILGSAEIIHAA